MLHIPVMLIVCSLQKLSSLALAQTQESSPKLFDFRRHCVVRHMNGTYRALCHRNNQQIDERNLHIDGRSTTGVSEVELYAFDSVILEASVQMEKITIGNTKNVSLYINNGRVKDVNILNVIDLTLKHSPQKSKSRLTGKSLGLKNINKLHLLNEGKFDWSIQLITFQNIEDVELGSSRLDVFANNFTISESNIRLRGSAVLAVTAHAIKIIKSVIYIHENGCFNMSVDQLLVENSNIYLESGTIQLANSTDVTISQNSLYGLKKDSILINNPTNFELIQNDIFTSHMSGVLDLNKENVKFYHNKFGCNDCSLKRKLLITDLKDFGDVNFCYTGCNLTLNAFKDLLEKSCVCTELATEVSSEEMCFESNVCETHADLPQWVTLSAALTMLLITVVLGSVLYFYFRRRKSFMPATVAYKRAPAQKQAYSNDTCDTLYEVVEPVDSR